MIALNGYFSNACRIIMICNKSFIAIPFKCFESDIFYIAVDILRNFTNITATVLFIKLIWPVRLNKTFDILHTTLDIRKILQFCGLSQRVCLRMFTV